MNVEINIPGVQRKWYTWTYSNFLEWARANPEAAEALTK
jgi:hypothetical protein